jgi:DNA-directed RNA polymerase subunit D
MHVQVLGKTDEEIRMVVDEINPQFANCLRRIMISRIPTLAVEYVNFHKNDSALYDEMLSHRIGMLALKFDPKVFKIKDNCDCEGKGCSQCEIVFVLEKSGPCKIYASDLKSSDSDAASIVHSETLLGELLEGQELKLDAVASLGLGKTHAKHQAAHVYFRQYPSVKVGKVSNTDEVIQSCSKRALSLDGKGSVTVDCDLCGECVKTANPKGSVEVSGVKHKFIFDVETISGLTAEQIFLKSIDVLKKEAKDFGKQVSKLK